MTHIRKTNKLGFLISYENQKLLEKIQQDTNMSFSQIVNKLIEDAQCGTETSKGISNVKTSN